VLAFVQVESELAAIEQATNIIQEANQVGTLTDGVMMCYELHSAVLVLTGGRANTSPVARGGEEHTATAGHQRSLFAAATSIS